MPGTGKTTTIAYIIKILVEKGKSILLTSYTHTAVDNLLLKLQEIDIEFVRLGKSENIHPKLLPCSLDFNTFQDTTALRGNKTDTLFVYYFRLFEQQKNICYNVSWSESSFVFRDQI